ncbi:MAG: tRNA lysidine(34) synthetase TilS [Fusicatenibacter sp.]|nr:tRNA lysidine(34) synthetase TilS [Fusicatenibacter sp.]
MRKKIKEYIEKYHMIQPGDTVLCGLSGGADSVFLFSVLMELREELQFSLQAVHVNHNLRGDEADRDALFVQELCEENGVPFYLYSCPVELMAKEEHLSIEEAGRQARHAAFEDCMAKYHATKLALAHHQNDLVETMLYHIARGTSLSGLASMRPVRGHTIRPLLCLSRAQIEQELLSRKIRWCEDSSNQGDLYTRNKIRHHVVPYLTYQVNDQLPMHAASLSMDILEAEEYLESQAQKLYENYVCEDQGSLLISEKAGGEAPIMKRYLIRKCMEHLAGKWKDLTREHVEAVTELFGKGVGKQVDLPYQMRAVREYHQIRMVSGEAAQKDSRDNKRTPKMQALPQEGCVTYLGYEICVTRLTCEGIFEGNVENKYTKCFDCDKISGNLVLRTRKSGDYLTINPSGGRKKLKDYMIDAKIPREQRDSVLLLADGDEILWIVGYRTGERHRVEANTRNIIQIQIKGGKTNE